MSRLIICLFMAITTGMSAQKIATLSVELPTAPEGLEVPLNTNLDALTFIAESDLILYQVIGKNLKSIPFQVSQNPTRTLHWCVKSNNNAKGIQVFELHNGKRDYSRNASTISKDDGSLIIKSGDNNLLKYNFKTVYPPAGVDTAYRRSGFIHPLWSPHGQVLTRIQAPDHYHHYGIWNPWTHVLFEKDTVDFWNLKDRKGTVRFAKFVAISEGPVFSEYQTLHEHVAFKQDGTEKTALNEVQTVRVYRPDSSNYYFMDITIQLNCASESPVELLEYRYGGLGWRTTEEWHKDNSEVLTSEGKTRKDADNSTARWCIVQGTLGGNDYGGAVMLSYPANFNHPEPLRIWPENQNGRGDMYANFTPTKNKNWLLEPHKTYVLTYRWLVFNGKMTQQRAESAWQNFAKPPTVRVKSN